MRLRILPMRHFMVLAGLFIFQLAALGQLTVDNTVNATDGVQNVLLGPGVTASNITFIGQPEQIGSFVCNGCGISISNGLVLSTGNIDGAIGPNNAPDYSGGPPDPTISDFVGDNDLYILNGTNNTVDMHNAAVLEFDFVPAGDSVSFSFVFSSEEYLEYVGIVNDVFGFFISGPGISGPYTNNAANIALIPGTTTPITINDVNDQLNSQYYVDNDFGSFNVQPDGFTTVLTASSQVQCGQTYHIKLAIGDSFDAAYDSWVFIEGGSFQSNQLTAQFTPGGFSAPNGALYEGCGNGNITYTRTGDLSTAATFTITNGGTAQSGIDFGALPADVTFAAGQSTVSLPIVINSDSSTEGDETLDITLNAINGCGDPITVTQNLVITDLPPLQVSLPDTTIDCGTSATLSPTISGGIGNYHILWYNGANTMSITVSPLAAADYTYVVTDTCGVAAFNGTVHVGINAVTPISVSVGADQALTCLDPLIINPTVSGGFGTLNYTWNYNGGFYSNDNSVNAVMTGPGTMTLTITDQCQNSGTDSMDLTIPPVPVTVSLGPDLTVTCLDQTVLTPTVTGGVGTYSYSWSSPTTNLGTATSITHQTNSTVTITVNVVDQCQNTNSDAIVLDVPAVPVSASLGPDLAVNCLDQTLLVPTVSGGVGTYSYQWDAQGSNLGTANQITYQTSTAATVVATITDQCGNSTSTSIQLNVPQVLVNTNIGQDITATCLDVNTLSPTSSGGVGTISYSWSLNGTPQGNANSLNVQVTNDATVIVTAMDQCGNITTDQLNIVVPPVPVIVDAGNNIMTECGSTVDLAATATGGVGAYSFVWTNGSAILANTDAIQFSPLQNSVLTVGVTDACGNTGSDQLSVNIIPNPISIDLGDPIVATCLDQIPLDAAVSGGSGNYVYNWSVGGSSLSTNATTTYQTFENAIVTLSITDECGNAATEDLNIFIPPHPINIITSPDTAVCVNESVMLHADATGGVGNLTYVWESDSTHSQDYSLVAANSAIYHILVVDQCLNVGEESVLVQAENVIPMFSTNLLGDNVFELTNASEGAYAYFWEFSDGATSGETNVTHAFATTDNWMVTLYATSPLGCTKAISGEFVPEGQVYIPNTFTPNHDGHNDELHFYGHDLKRFEIKIFNRWGEKIFETNDIDAVWDGSDKGGEYFVPDGVYLYHFIAEGKRMNIQEGEGHIIILR